jgi:signal transduction histidine kinase
MLVNIVDRIADRVRWGYLTAFILLLSSYILTFYTTQKLLNQANWLNHTNSFINTLDGLLSTINQGESTFRGYVIEKDEQFLNDYYNSAPLIDSAFKKLEALSIENPDQLTRLDTLAKLIKEKFTYISAGLALFKKENYQVTDSLKILNYRSKEKMDNIRLLISSMQNDEKEMMFKRSGRLSSFSNFIKIINIASLIVAILLTFYSIITYTRENQAKKQADYNARVFREQLELRIKELDIVNKELIELRSMEKFAVTGRISRTIAHEVRNPLTNINLATEHLRSEITPNPETDILLDMITRNGNRINQLISDLLNSTKINQLQFAKVPLNNLLDESLEFAQDRLELKGIKVIKNYTPDLCDISADTEKLKIAFLNIIVNAIEAMEPNKGVLRIKTENRNGRCVAVITDNGKGMSDEQLTKLYDPYFTTKENGTGLGLTNTQNIIISHKASIFAESEVGKGTTFSVTLNYA